MSRPEAAGILNLGEGQDVSIRELAEMIRDVVGFQGQLRFDASRPDGMPRKCLDSTDLFSLGWRSGTSLAEGLAATYRWRLQQLELKDKAVHV